MKKTLLVLFLSSLNVITAQTLQSENFTTLSVGNIGTDLTGAAPGQGGFYTYVAASGANSNFQIVSQGGAYGNVLQVTGSATASNTRYIWKDGLDTAWSTRTSGNDIIQVEYDFFTGPATTSKNTVRVVLYNSDGSKMLGGLTMAQDTKIISGLSYYNNGGTLNNYSFNLAATPVTLAANTWVRVGFTFNKTTGDVIWKGPGFYSGVTGAAAGLDPFEVDFIVTAGTGNAVASTALYDNFTAKAVSTESLLGIEDFQTIASEESIVLFPNPVNDFISVRFPSNFHLNTISFTDINGRIVKKISEGEMQDYKMDISDLKSGVYLVVLQSDNGINTQKIIKN